MLPASTAAASYGKITNTSWSCKNGGNKVVANFKLVKYSGFHATPTAAGGGLARRGAFGR